MDPVNKLPVWQYAIFLSGEGRKKVDKLETGNGETGIGLSEVSPLAVGLFTLVVSILLAGLIELVRTTQVTHP